MNIDILGPIEVTGRDGRPVRLPTGRERSLFALLLLHRGSVVSTDVIVETLWGARPPDTAAKAVHGYISHLRRVLEPDREQGDGTGILITRPPGYALLERDLSVDATRFEQLAGDGRRALEDGSPAEALPTLDEALALWRGPVLAEFAFEDFAREEIRRLEQLRLAAVEDRIEALLRLGRHAEVVGPLESLVAANPLRERLRGQWMLALYRSGRQADALEAYREGRRLLSAELGLDPAPELQRLERAILEQDAALAAPPLSPQRQPPAGADAPPQRGPVRTRRIAAALLIAAALVVVLFALVRSRLGDTSAPRVSAPALVGVDASTNRIVASIPVGSRPTSVAATADAIWVGDAKDGTVVRVDPKARRVVTTIGIGAPAIDLAVGSGSVWAATGGFGTVVRIDPRLDAVADRIELGNPSDPIVPAVSSVGAGDGRVWIGAFDGLVPIDPRTDTLGRHVDIGQFPAIQIAVGDGAVWSTLITRRAVRVDASAGKVTAHFYAGTLATAIALAHSAVWLAGVFGGQLWELDPVTATTIQTSAAGNSASSIALDARSVWIASWNDHTLVRVDRATGAVRATIPLHGEPEDVVVHDGIVWVAVQRTSDTA
jgi:DNA-binding SARP family transcriptional activator